MAKAMFICLAFLVVFAVLYEVDCKENQSDPKQQKGWKKQSGKALQRQMVDEEVETNDIAGDVESEEEWRQRIDLKKQRLAQPENGYRSNASDSSSRRRQRDVSTVTPAPDLPEDIPDPPDHKKVAEVARFIVHNSGTSGSPECAWASGAYINKHPGKVGLPMATLFSVSDGFANASTGIPYMYITPKDIAVQDLAKDNRCSLLMSLAQTDYCKRKKFDPEDPRCAYVILTGKIKQLRNGTDEWDFASKIYFDRHPTMRDVPVGHKFRLAKFKISDLAIQDYFGGMKFPSVKDYFAVKLNDTLG